MLALTAGVFTAHILCSDCNDGFFVENQIVAIESSNYTVATMINSYNARTWVVARRYKRGKSYGFYLGLATGYDEHYWPIIPVFALYYNFGDYRVTAMSESIAISYSVEF